MPSCFFEMYHSFICGKVRVGRLCRISFAVVPVLSFVTTSAIDSKIIIIVKRQCYTHQVQTVTIKHGEMVYYDSNVNFDLVSLLKNAHRQISVLFITIQQKGGREHKPDLIKL